MSGNDFRVLIAGGSIAGLSLALALEKHGVDFLVLEGHGEIAPQVGASIAVLPSGFRVLDQLGCYEDIMAMVNCTIDNFIIRDVDGTPLLHVEDLEEHLIRRHGYPMIFFERRMVIEVLYRHIRQKDKVLTSKRVVGIRQDEKGVAVECQDGSGYEGSILIGADGIHSTVGQHMAQTRNGGSKQEGGLPVQYRCLFGISEKVPGIGEDTLHHVSNYGSSLFAASGPNDRTYWCLFTNTGSTYYGDALPPYGEKDEAETVEKHGNDAVTETFNPIIGLGGMSALETTAALTNNLVALLKASNNPSTSELESVLVSTQNSRRPRAKALIDVSMLTQHRFAMETPWMKFINRYYCPAMGPRSALRLLSEAYPGAVSLELKGEEKKSGLPNGKAKELPSWLPKPDVRSLPYEDELLHQPMPRSTLASGTITTLLVGLFVLGVYSLLYLGHVNGTFRLVDEAVWQGAVEITGRGITDLRLTLGENGWLSGLNNLAKTLVAVFLPLVAESGTEPAVLERKLQAGYFLLSVYLPVLAVILIEGSRKRNTWSLIWSPTAWLVAAQLLGLGLVLPLYVLAFFRSSSRTAYWMPAERFVPYSFSKAIIPALVLGFLVPSGLMAASTTFIPDYAQELVAFWQISPALTSWMAEWISGFLVGPKRGVDGKGKKMPLEDYQGVDMAGLKILYNSLFVVSSVAHTTILLALLWIPGLSVIEAFVPGTPRAPVADIADGVGVFFRFDLLLTVASIIVWCLINCAEMRRVGIVGMPLCKITGLLVAGCVVIGPGAMFVAFWKRREMKMARPELRA
ncbi:FAD-dependent urate hydroxylase [Cytospora mali]|uniref:FAD-dependent urate hydroxylase n=1 Tax=Cytospora mali TaxID=578113 RepID=A0A194UXZ3_CYTMA|nr:FAD-dependent urate hydroxylase [Valsa mali var. pyri (nom. inval.)]